MTLAEVLAVLLFLTGVAVLLPRAARYMRCLPAY
jgi:hypothetical protein